MGRNLKSFGSNKLSLLPRDERKECMKFRILTYCHNLLWTPINTMLPITPTIATTESKHKTRIRP